MIDKMEGNNSLEVEVLEDGLLKACFRGERGIEQVIDNWLQIRSFTEEVCNKLLILDFMTGKMCAGEISFLLEVLAEYNYFKKKKIAIVLDNDNSHTQRFFEIYSKNLGIDIKHFFNEKAAMMWLFNN